jgi:hypothetical protein
MTTNDTRRYQMLVRVRDFGETHGHLFSETSVAEEQFTIVAAAVKELSGDAVTQMSAQREGASTKALARQALTDRLEAIALTARALAVHAPGMRDKFRMLRRPLTDQTRLTAGRLFARDAEGFTEPFVAHGMPPTFIADLTALVDAFEGAIQARDEERGGRTVARASIAAALASGTAAVRSLDALVTNYLRDDLAATTLWRSVRRVSHPRRAKGAAAATSSPTEDVSSPAGAVAAPAPVEAAPETSREVTTR